MSSEIMIAAIAPIFAVLAIVVSYYTARRLRHFEEQLRKTETLNEHLASVFVRKYDAMNEAISACSAGVILALIEKDNGSEELHRERIQEAIATYKDFLVVATELRSISGLTGEDGGLFVDAVTSLGVYMANVLKGEKYHVNEFVPLHVSVVRSGRSVHDRLLSL